MADWVTISSLATAGGTLVLAVATFSSVRSANRSARVAEQSLLVGMRPVLIPSREDDPVERVRFGDGYTLSVHGHGAAIEAADGHVYMALGLRNGGQGLAVLHGWRVTADAGPRDVAGAARSRRLPPAAARSLHPRRRHRLLAGRGPRRRRPGAGRACAARSTRGQRVIIDVLYGDHEGGQRTIARFGVTVDERDSKAAGRR